MIPVTFCLPISLVSYNVAFVHTSGQNGHHVTCVYCCGLESHVRTPTGIKTEDAVEAVTLEAGMSKQ